MSGSEGHITNNGRGDRTCVTRDNRKSINSKGESEQKVGENKNAAHLETKLRRLAWKFSLEIEL